MGKILEKNIRITIQVDTTGLDEAIEKAHQLKDAIKELSEKVDVQED